MSVDVGQVGIEWLVVVLAVGVLVALIGGPLRDLGWRRGIEAELRIAERMRGVATSAADREAAERFASRVIRKADDLERRSSNVHALRNLPFRLPFTVIFGCSAVALSVYMVAWAGRDPSGVPVTIIVSLLCGLLCDVTRPSILSAKRPRRGSSRGEGKRDARVCDGEQEEEKGDASDC